MAKAEERAFERYPDYREMDGGYVTQIHKRKVFAEGYHQAEKDRVLPQLKQEWSEVDNARFEDAIQMIESNGTCVRSDDAVKLVSNWLKSLKQRSTWKPSDEQMETLLSEVTAWTKGCPKQIVLESLYNDLIKLKE